MATSSKEQPDFNARFRAIVDRYFRGELTLEQAAEEFARVWEESTQAPRHLRTPNVKAPIAGLSLRTGDDLVEEPSDEEAAKLDALIGTAFEKLKNRIKGGAA